VSALRRPTICLNMIVKDEAHVIRRCLDSVRPLIDHWIIVDTGSTDETKDIILDVFAEVPGTLYERPWKNFGHNRSEALDLCEGIADYVLTIDADEILQFEEGFVIDGINADYCTVIKRRGVHEYRVPSLLKTSCEWRWEGVLHEQPYSDIAKTGEMLDGVVIVSPAEGARALDPHTYRKDALMLEAALIEDPDNPRTVFYLAQSYRDAEDYDNAIRYYTQRLSMKGWRDERYMSLLQIGVVKTMRGDPWPECMEALLKAQAHTPERIEPIYKIGMYYALQKEWELAWLFLEKAAKANRADPDHLFVESDIYDWRAKLEAALAAYWTGRHTDSIALNENLLASDHLPEKMRARVEANLKLSQNALETEPA